MGKNRLSVGLIQRREFRKGWIMNCAAADNNGSGRFFDAS